MKPPVRPLCDRLELALRTRLVMRGGDEKSGATDEEGLCSIPSKIVTAGEPAGQRVRSFAAGMIDRSEWAT